MKMRRLGWATVLGAWLATAAAWAAIPADLAIDMGRTAGSTGASPEIRSFTRIPFAAWPAYRNAPTGKAQVLGDTVATETTSTPPAATLAHFDSAYQQLLQGGANQ